MSSPSSVVPLREMSPVPSSTLTADGMPLGYPSLVEAEPSFESDALDYLRSKGFSEAAPEPLDSPHFPDTFAPSAFHGLVLNRVTQPVNRHLPGKLAGCDWVYRHIDIEKIGSSEFHLSAFKMLVFLEAVEREQEVECYERNIIAAMDLLAIMGRGPEDLFVTYYGGESSFVQESLEPAWIAELWSHYGVPADHLVAVRGDSHLTNVRRVGEPAGPRCELFLRTALGSYVEVGTVVLERYVLNGDQPLKLEPAPTIVSGAAFGVERAEMVRRGMTSVFEVPELHEGILAIESGMSPVFSSIHHQGVKRMVDAARSCLIILSQCSLPLGPARVRRVAKLRKIVLRASNELGLADPGRHIRGVVSALQPSHAGFQQPGLVEEVVHTLVG